MPAAPRSSKVTKLLEDGTLIVKGQEVGKVDPTATNEGQLVVPVRPRPPLNRALPLHVHVLHQPWCQEVCAQRPVCCCVGREGPEVELECLVACMDQTKS